MPPGSRDSYSFSRKDTAPSAMYVLQACSLVEREKDGPAQ